MDRLGSVDSGFLALESRRVYTHIGSIMVLDAGSEGFDAESLAARIDERLHLLPPFRRRLVEVPFGLGHPYWADDPDFDLDFHIRESGLPPPGNARQFAAWVARTFSRPLDRSRPLWEMWVVHGLEGNRVAVVTKIHHAAVDGISGTELLSVLLDEYPAEPPESDEAWHGERIPHEAELLARGVADLGWPPGRTLRALPGAISNLSMVPGATVVPGVPSLLRAWRARAGGDGSDDMLEVTTARAPATPFNGPITAHRRYAWGGLDLARCKKVKNAAGVKLNDVVLAVCAGSIRAWLDERDALPREPLVAAIPVSVRADGGEGFGNRIGMMTGPLATHMADPVERLRWTARAMSGAKDRHGALPADALTDAAQFVPPAVAALAARTTLNVLSRLRAPLNVLVSNVPGPRDALHCLGAEISNLYAVPPIVDGLGLNVTVVSYRDELGVGITTDREQIEDPWSLLGGCRDSLDELEAALT